VTRGKNGEVVGTTEKTERTEEELPPEPNLLRLWNVTRNPKRWKQQQTVEHHGTFEHIATLATLPQAKLQELESMLDNPPIDIDATPVN